MTVSTACQIWRIVSAMQRKKAPGASPTISAVMMAATRIAVPVPSG